MTSHLGNQTAAQITSTYLTLFLLFDGCLTAGLFCLGRHFTSVLCGSNPLPFLVEPDPDKMCLLIKINQHFQVHAVFYELLLYGVIGALM